MKPWVKNVAVKLAATSSYPRYQHGAAIERGGNILALGVNSAKPHRLNTARSTTHAEEHALKLAGEAASGASLYVARVTKGKIAHSRPCEECQALIREAGVRRVYYSIDAQTWAEFEL